ncbi:1,4-alpha-glucan branching protein, partial [Streptomyces caniscabiei]|nr:1,4-alpha-glucan branching protein [Streptomyces caniscabiei]
SPATDTAEATELPLTSGATTLHLNRVLHPAPLDLPPEAKGQLTGHWTLPDETRVRGIFAVLR